MTTFDPYAVLGVKKDATVDQIRAAWRKGAKTAHPDRNGGDTAKMAALNHAYECLSDSVRRIRFDATGNDAPNIGSIEEEAARMVNELCSAAIDADAGDVVSHVRGQALQGATRLTQAIRKAQDRIAALGIHRKRVHSKATVNLVHAIIDSKVVILEQTIEHNKRGVEVMNAAVALLRDYSFAPEPAPTQTSFMSGFIFQHGTLR